VTKYYGIQEANDRLEELRPLLEGLREDRDELARLQESVARRLPTNGNDGYAAEHEHAQERIIEIVRDMKRAVARIDALGVTLRDIGTGLIDFPAMATGRPIWLCWRLGEGDIDWWHELDTGFSSRKPLLELI
jgi:hypothetical protein